MSAPKDDLAARLALRLEIPITAVTMAFDRFGEMASDIVRSSFISDEVKQEVVTLKKDMMDMELRLRKLMDTYASKGKDKESCPPTTTDAPDADASKKSATGWQRTHGRGARVAKGS